MNSTMPLIRLLVSTVAVLGLLVGLVVVATVPDRNETALAVIGAALTLAIQNLVTQISSENAAANSRSAAASSASANEKADVAATKAEEVASTLATAQKGKS